MAGSRIKLLKCDFFVVGFIAEPESFASIFSLFGAFLTSYLVMLLGALYKSQAIWDLVVERFEKRLTGWKGLLVQTRKIWPSSLPTYFTSLIPLLALVFKRFHQLMRDFV